MSFERYTQGAREVVSGAEREARALDCDAIGPEHVFLALLSVSADEAREVAQILSELRITAEAVRPLMERGSVVGSVHGHVPYTDDAKRLLEWTFREALSLGHSHIAVGHLFLGLTRNPKIMLKDILVRLGVDEPAVAELRRRVTELKASQEAPPVHFTDAEVMRILGRLLATAKLQLVRELMTDTPATAPVAAEMIEDRYRALNVPDLEPGSCIEQAVTLQELVRLLKSTDLIARIDVDLPRAVHQFVTRCLDKYKQFVLDE